jgi:predicted P-loop ATPase
MRLSDADYQKLEESYITREIAIAAGIYRVPSIEGAELVGRKGSGNYQGIALPCWWPGTTGVTTVRLRLDYPPTDLRNGKSQYKYLTAPGTRNRFYMPLEDPALLADHSVPIYLTEGEKKYLGLHRAAEELSPNGTGRPAFLAIALWGVWSWKGLIGYRNNANGERVEVRGVIPDFDRVLWTGREVYIIFDTNVLANDSVRAARLGLARELEARGATVYLVNLPPSPGVNGVDDFLYRFGLPAFLEVVKSALRYDWRDALARTEKGKVLGTLGNALTALRLAPVWQGVLWFNEFALAVAARKALPWGGPPGAWTDHQDLLTTEWMEHQGIRLNDIQVGKAVLTAAKEHLWHPVREYLDGLEWDSVPRLNQLFPAYFGSKDDEYTQAVGPNFFIGAVARIEDPGCRVDHVPILEGPQGGGKSRAVATIGGEYATDNIPDLGTKDAQLALVSGLWIIEIAELDAMSRAEVTRIKAVLSRPREYVRPPYHKNFIWASRQCVFIGTVNHNVYLRDETGGRRFWPVECGQIRVDDLSRDRDQLWAEAKYRYDHGEKWWLGTPELEQEAAAEQEERYSSDPWESLVEPWLLNQTEVTTADCLFGPINKNKDQWTRLDEMRVAAILGRLGWRAARRAPRSQGRRRIYTKS